MLSNLINDLLDMAQLKVGKFKLNIKKFDLKELIMEVFALMKVPAESQ